MGENHAPRGKSSVRCRLGFAYTSALTDDADANQAGIRVVKTTSEGFDVIGHGHRITNVYDDVAVTATPPAAVEVDTSEEGKTIFTLESTHDEDLDVTLSGLHETGGTEFPLETITLTAGGFADFRVLSDPWPLVKVEVTIPGSNPTTGLLNVRALRRT